MSKNKLNIRQKINRSRLNADERMLRESGIVSEKGGVLTDLGRRVVLDVLWDDDELRSAVISNVREALDAEKEEAKAKK